MRDYHLVALWHEREPMTLEALAYRADLHPALVERFVEFGLLEPMAREGEQLFFDPATLPRLRVIIRLRETLGINLPGIAVILDLLDRIDSLQGENKEKEGRR